MNYKIKLKNIKTFIFDIDGVLTDGKVYIIDRVASRAINTRDIYTIKKANQLGYKLFYISGGSYEPIKDALLSLGANEVFLGITNKIDCFNSIVEKHKLVKEEILYMGDDMPDIPVLKQVGLSSCPNNAATDVKDIVDYVSPYNGGKHCVRDVMEQTFRVQGVWG
jgi:3-deoxy-D-manno-octulosonate 8-phosphate phosphatase (KDO 8-P phosphatase)